MSSTSVARLSVNLIANTTNFTNQMRASQRVAERFKRVSAGVERNLRNMTRIGLRAGVAMAALSGGILMASRSAAKYADQIDKMAVRTNMTRESLQELQHVSRITGVQFESLERSIGMLGRRLVEDTGKTSAAGRVISKLGLQVHDANGEVRDMTSLFDESIAVLAEWENITERNAMAMELFGRGAIELIPLLAAGTDEIERLRREARDLGLVMSEDVIRDLTLFHDELATTQARLGAVWRVMAADFVPALRVVNEWLGRGIGYLQGIDQEQRMQIVRWTVYAGAILGTVAAMGLLAKAALIMMGALKAVGMILLLLASPKLLAIAGLAWTGIQIYRSWNRVAGVFKRTAEFLEKIKAIWADEDLTLPEKVVEIAELVFDVASIAWADLNIGTADILQGLKTALIAVGAFKAVSVVGAALHLGITGKLILTLGVLSILFSDSDSEIMDILKGALLTLGVFKAVALIGLKPSLTLAAALVLSITLADPIIEGAKTVIDAIYDALEKAAEGRSKIGGVDISDIIPGIGGGREVIYDIPPVEHAIRSTAAQHTLPHMGMDLGDFLVRLAELESSLDPHAVQAQTGAVGLFQFMPATYQKLIEMTGEEFDWSDPIKATEAAIVWLRGALVNEMGTIESAAERLGIAFEEALHVWWVMGGPDLQKAISGSAPFSTVATRVDGQDITVMDLIRKFREYQDGGIIPGFGGGDRHPALLEAGEAVVPAQAVRGGLGSIVQWFKSMGVPRYQAGHVPGAVANVPIMDPVFGLAEKLMGEEAARTLENTIDMVIGALKDLDAALRVTEDIPEEMEESFLIEIERAAPTMFQRVTGKMVEMFDAFHDFASAAFMGIMRDEEGQIVSTALMQLKDAALEAASGLIASLNPINLIAQLFERIVPIGAVLEGFLEALAPVTEALAEPLKEIGFIIGQVLAPIFMMLAPILQALAKVVMGVARAIAAVWNALISALDVIVFWTSLDKWKININEAAEATEDFTRAMNEALRNVPAAFRFALERWRATIPAQTIPSAQTGAIVTQTGAVNVHAGEEIVSVRDRARGNTYNIHISGDNYGIDDLKRKLREALSEITGDDRGAEYGLAGGR